MRLPLNWLKEFVPLRETPEQLAELLTLSGSEVESIERGSRLDPKIVVGEVKTVIQHPTADRLKVTRVQSGDAGLLTIVCGAPNVAPEQKVAVAMPGAKLPNGETLQVAKIRGVESEGMLLAENELGIGADHTGIVVLDSQAKVGEPVGKWLGANDVIFSLEITPNRSDCFSILGLAREVSAVTRRPMHGKRYELVEGETDATSRLTVKVIDGKACPKYIARMVKGVHVGSSLQWMQSRLRASGIRPINAVVDVTNYVMVELGQPLHAFDAGKVGKRIVVRRARKGEKIVTLDGQDRKLESSDIVITDGRKPIAIAGVMGGRDTEVTEKTREIILESAIFDPVSIRRTARRLNLRSEASSRFERGIDWKLPEKAADRAAAMLQLTANGKVLRGRVAVAAAPVLRPVIQTTPERINGLLGSSFSPEGMVDLLTRLHIPASVVGWPALIKTDVTSKQQLLVRAAKQLLGKPYPRTSPAKGVTVRGSAPLRDDGSGKKGSYDCSGFVREVYRRVGVAVPRTTVEQVTLGRSVKGAYAPGDLLFTRGKTPHFSTQVPNGVGHVGLCIGNGKVIHAKDGIGVVETTVKKFTQKDFRGARRLLGVEQPSVLLVIPPTFRPDVKLPEDVAEEVGRLYGYNRLPLTYLSGAPKPAVPPPDLAVRERVRDALAGVGFAETYSYSFYSDVVAREVDPSHYTIANPLNDDQRNLRRTLLPTLLATLERNLHQHPDRARLRLFEVGRIFLRGSDRPGERWQLGLGVGLRSGSLEAGQTLLTGAWRAFLASVHLDPARFVFSAVSSSSNRVNVAISRRSDAANRIGRIVVRSAMEKNLAVAALEVDLDVLRELLPDRPTYRRMSQHPVSVRDLAVVVSASVPYADLLRTISATDLRVVSVSGFDRHRQADGTYSVAFHLTYQDSKKTLTADEIDRIHHRIIHSLEQHFGARLRT